MPLFTLSSIKIVILLFYLIVVLIIVLLNWLYHNRTIRVTKAIGLHAPEYIRVLVRVSIINALFTACLITIFLVTSVH